MRLLCSFLSKMERATDIRTKRRGWQDMIRGPPDCIVICIEAWLYIFIFPQFVFIFYIICFYVWRIFTSEGRLRRYWDSVYCIDHTVNKPVSWNLSYYSVPQFYGLEFLWSTSNAIDIFIKAKAQSSIPKFSILHKINKASKLEICDIEAKPNLCSSKISILKQSEAFQRSKWKRPIWSKTFHDHSEIAHEAWTF